MNPRAPPWPDIDNAISGSLGRPFATREITPVAGGCISTAVVISSENHRFFVKLNSASRLQMLEAEADGLVEIAGTHTVRVPSVVCAGTTGSYAFLVLEYLHLCRPGSRAAESLGSSLARMHSEVQAYFGWRRDNTIGATPQPNERCTSWPDFFRRFRLQHQLALTRRTHRSVRGLQSKGERLCENLDNFFTGYPCYPSLLHGDLWSGNFSALADDEPVVFDPAVYFGDRETDIAMTELFGGFGAGFYQAYSAMLPLDAGYEVRRDLYKLYHVLNHFNLFGGGYAAQAENLADRLLAELG